MNGSISISDENLKTQGKRYRKRGSAKDKLGIIRERVDISLRPAQIENRERNRRFEDIIIGNWSKKCFDFQAPNNIFNQKLPSFIT